jgi:hypothetical protein
MLVSSAKMVVGFLQGQLSPEEYFTHFIDLGAPVRRSASADADSYRDADPGAFPDDATWSSLGNDGRFLATLEYIHARGPVVTITDPLRVEAWIGDGRAPPLPMANPAGRGVISRFRPSAPGAAGPGSVPEFMASLRVPIQFRDSKEERLMDISFVYDEVLGAWYPSMAKIYGGGIDLRWSF